MRRRGRLVALEGGSGSGKTTLVRAAARELNWAPIDEAFDRLDPAPSLEFDSPQQLLRLEGAFLAEEVRRYREARELCDRGRTVLADTGFLGPLTYTLGLVELGRAPPSVARSLGRSVRRLLRARSLGIPDLTVYLETTARERARRARVDRRRHPRDLYLRHEAVGAVERAYFRKAMRDSVPGRVRTLPAHAPPTRLVWKLGILVERASGPPASPAEGRRFVAGLLPSTAPARRPSGRPNR